MATSALKQKTAVGSSSRGTPKTKQVHKWQRTYEREHQSMVRLHAELDDQDKSLVSTLWCVVCRQYETRMCGPKDFSRAWIDGSSNHKMSSVTDHACGTKWTWLIVCYYCISMKCVRSTFSCGRSSYIEVWQSSGNYEIVIFIPTYSSH